MTGWMTRNSFLNRNNNRDNTNNNNGGNNQNNNNNNQNNNNNNQNGGNNNNGGQNNGGNNGDLSDNIWQVKSANNGGDNNNGGANGNQNNQNNQTTQNNGGQQPDPNKQFQDFLRKKGIKLTVPEEALTKFRADGDVGALMTAFQEASVDYGVNILQHGYQDITKMMETSINKAVDTAVAKATNNFQASDVIKQMHTAMPFTKDANIEPIAKVVLGQFIKNGEAPPTAVENVRKFFQHMSKLSAKDLGLTNNQSHGGGPGKGPYGGQQEDEMDWVGFMTTQAGTNN